MLVPFLQVIIFAFVKVFTIVKTNKVLLPQKQNGTGLKMQ